MTIYSQSRHRVAREIDQLAQRIAAAAGVVASWTIEVLPALNRDDARPRLAGPKAEIGPSRLTGNHVDFVPSKIPPAATTGIGATASTT